MMNEVAIDSRFLQPCDVPGETFAIEPFTMVIFGGGGDLAKRKLMPTLFHLCGSEGILKDFSVLGFGRSKMSDEEYRSVMKEAVQEFGVEHVNEDQWNEFSRHLFFFSGFFEDDDAYRRLRETIDRIAIPASDGGKDLIFYLAVPPQTVPVLIEKLLRHNFCKRSYRTKIIVEKPFGRDRASAETLNTILTGAFEENQIYRIDHYLGKEPVQNILYFRFSNMIFERLWNCRCIDNIQITVAEDIGIEHRGAFYEQTGVVRDIVQNHMLQLIALVGMEPLVGFKADFLRDEAVKVFRSIRPVDDAYIDKFMVRGQYGPGKVGEDEVPGYREEERVSPESNIQTFFAGKFYIDNLRWAGVPFYVRTGKRMQRRITEVAVQFKRLPLRLLGRTCDVMEPNILLLTIQPDEEITLRFNVGYPHSHNRLYSTNMVFKYRDTFGTKQQDAYARLLLDCVRGDLTLFVRQDAIETMWEVVDPIVARWANLAPADFPNYAAGTWGPEEALLLLKNEGRSWITA